MKRSYPSDILFNTINTCLFIVMAFITLYPFWNVAIISLNDPIDTLKGEIFFWPREFSLLSYKTIFYGNSNLLQALSNSVLRTAIGTASSVFSTTLLAYVLSRKDFIARKLFSRFFMLTMYINGGLIPTFVLYRQIGLMNNFAVYILPPLISAFYLLVMKSFMQDIPESLKEAAIIDGANDLQVFTWVIIPLCIPVIATIALYVAVFHWGSWQDTYFFASRAKNLTTLQYEMVKIISQASAQKSAEQVREQAQRNSMVTPQSIQSAIIMIATVPILAVYPFLQKYFVRGLTLGAVKE